MKDNLTKQLAAGMLVFALCAPNVHAQTAPEMKRLPLSRRGSPRRTRWRRVWGH